MGSHTRSYNCAICAQADEDTKAALLRWKRTNAPSDERVVHARAAERERHKKMHRRQMQPRNTHVSQYPEGFDVEYGVYQGGAWELGKNR